MHRAGELFLHQTTFIDFDNGCLDDGVRVLDARIGNADDPAAVYENH